MGTSIKHAESFVNAVCCISDLCKVSLQEAIQILVTFVLEEIING